MRLLAVALFTLTTALASHPTAWADAPPAGKVLIDEYDIAFLAGGQAGYTRFQVREFERDGQTIRRASRQLRLSVKRFNETITLQVESGTEENPKGQVIGVFMSQAIGKNVSLEMTGRVVDGKLKITFQGPQGQNTEMPWDPQAIGLIAEQYWLRDHKARAGDPIEYRTFEPTVTSFVTVRGKVVGPEEIMVEGQGKKTLVRAEVKPQPIQGVTLPGSVGWYDPETLLPVRTESEIPGLGKLVLVRSDQATATGAIRAPRVNVGLDNSIRLPQRVDDIHRLNSLVYRISFTDADGDLNPAQAFAMDPLRQKVEGSEGRTIDLKISPVRAPRPVKDPQADPGEEFTASNFFINSDDELVRKHAAEAVGEEADPWRKAQLIERWVRRNMKTLNFQQSMAPADQVARELEGDCSEFSMLAAAMCRAVGIPSRTALGLVYAEIPGSGPMLAYHMWTEVWVKGQWLAIDATLGMGSVGAGHLKISDHSWHKVRDLTPTLPVLRVMMGKPVVSFP